jgi:hypothetical protein
MVNFTHSQDITYLKNELVRACSEVKLEAMVKLEKVMGVKAKEQLWQPEVKPKVEGEQTNVGPNSRRTTHVEPRSRTSKPGPQARASAKAAKHARRDAVVNARSARKARRAEARAAEKSTEGA